MAPPKKTRPSDQDDSEFDRRRPTGGNGGPMDYTGTDDDVPPPSLAHVRLDWGGGGRRQKLNQNNIHQMALLVAAGTPIPAACTAIGAGYSFKRWGTKAREDEKNGIEPGFKSDESPELFWLYAMEQAKAAFEASMVARIGAAAVVDWKAAAWLLERRASQRWYLKSRLEMHVNSQKTVEITTMSTDKLIQIARGILPDSSDVKVFDVTPNQLHDGSQRDVVDAEIED